MVGQGRPRDVGRNYLSGSSKRKAKDEKEKKENELLAKTPKLSNYFKSGGSSSQEAGESSQSLDSSQSLAQNDLENEKENENESESPNERGSQNENENRSANENDIVIASEYVNEDENEKADETANENELNHSEDVRENQSTPSLNLITSFDLGTWPAVIDRNNQDHLICRGSLDCQHMNGDFKESKRFYENEKKNRFCSKSVFL